MTADPDFPGSAINGHDGLTLEGLATTNQPPGALTGARRDVWHCVALRPCDASSAATTSRQFIRTIAICDAGQWLFPRLCSRGVVPAITRYRGASPSPSSRRNQLAIWFQLATLGLTTPSAIASRVSALSTSSTSYARWPLATPRAHAARVVQLGATYVRELRRARDIAMEALTTSAAEMGGSDPVRSNGRCASGTSRRPPCQ